MSDSYQARHCMIILDTTDLPEKPANLHIASPTIYGTCRHCDQLIFGKHNGETWRWFNVTDCYAHPHRQERRRHA